MLPSQAGEGEGLVGPPRSPVASSPRLAFAQRLGIQSQAPPLRSACSAQARGFASCESWQGRTGRAGAAPHRPGGHWRPRSGCQVARFAQGKEKPGLGAQDFLGPWARPPPAWPHRHPL